MTPTDQELNIAVAQACGWTEDHVFPVMFYCDKNGSYHTELPDYGADLNAMNAAERYAKEHLMNGDQWKDYGVLLEKIHPTAALRLPGFGDAVDYYDFATLMIEVTAAQRRECWLKLLNLYPTTATMSPAPNQAHDINCRKSNFNNAECTCSVKYNPDEKSKP